jgi:flagellar protein FlbD
MIQLTRLNKQPLVLNSDLIKTIEYAPDTVITLVNGEKIVVLETGEKILELIVGFRRRVLGGLQTNFTGWTAPNAEAPEIKPQGPPSEEA